MVHSQHHSRVQALCQQFITVCWDMQESGCLFSLQAEEGKVGACKAAHHVLCCGED